MHPEKKKIHTLIGEQKFEEALEALIVLFEKSGMDAEVYYLIGTCFYAKEDVSNAVRFLEKANEIEPNRYDYLLSLGMAYEAFGEERKAFSTYVKLAKMEKDLPFAAERLEVLTKRLYKT